MASLTQQQIRAVQIGLGMVKRCARCGETKLVAEFREYGWPTCDRCDHPEQYDRCPECGMFKLHYMLRCLACARARRRDAVISA